MPPARPVPPKPEAVYFFATCLVDLFFPAAGLAGMELLRAAGITVIFPPGQTCCGQPAANSGFPAEARRVARQQFAAFPAALPIVVPSGSCAAMMHRHYPALFAGQPDQAEAEAFADRVYELTWFLFHVCGFDPESCPPDPPARVTWHGSCHAQREMEVDAEPQALLRALPAVELLPLKRPGECCGFGGTFCIRQPEISAAMVSDKVADIVGTGAAEVLSADCGCLLNITGALDKAGIAVRGRHIAEFLWERRRRSTAEKPS